MGAGRGSWVGVELVVRFARPLVDALLVGFTQDAAGAPIDIARQLLAVSADERRDLVARSGDPFFLEGPQPALDACVDRVDQRAVEIEDQRFRRRKRVESGQRRLR